MWASDFPHTDSTWPNSLKVIDQDFEGVPPEVTQQDHLRQRGEAVQNRFELKRADVTAAGSPPQSGWKLCRVVRP